MSTYYFLVNRTKKQKLHLDYNFKEKAIRENVAVQYAFSNYMLENPNDDMAVLPDYDWLDTYEQIDLLEYDYKDPRTLEKIKHLLDRSPVLKVVSR